MTAVTKLDEARLLSAFPEVDPGCIPFGERVLVQIRTPKVTSSGGIILPEDTVDTEKWNIQVGKVISIGPGAFKNRDTLEPWPEGQWCQIGDFVRVPKYGGDRWNVLIPSPKKMRGEESHALFVVVKDLEIIGKITGDPLAVLAYI
jgi:co-chaperonin GroES (HSP10)